MLEEWLKGFLLPLFGRRILPVTREVADRWAALTARRRRSGAPLATADGLTAATALEHSLTPVTRNDKDFAGLDIDVLNPRD